MQHISQVIREMFRLGTPENPADIHQQNEAMRNCLMHLVDRAKGGAGIYTSQDLDRWLSGKIDEI